MKIIKHILLLIISFRLASCSLFTKQPATLTAADTLAITNAICSHYDSAQNISVENKFIDHIDIFWNDPSYVKGPSVDVSLIVGL